MSHWDFGRPPAEHHDALPPHASGAGEPGYPSGTIEDGEWWPDASGDWWPPGDHQAGGDGTTTAAAAGGWPGQDDGTAGRDDEHWDEDELGPYPVTYERDPAAEPAGPLDAGDPRLPAPQPAVPADTFDDLDDLGGPAGSWAPRPYLGNLEGIPPEAQRTPWTPRVTPPDVAGGNGAASAPRRPWSPGGEGEPGPAPAGTGAWAMSANATAAARSEEWADWDLETPLRPRGGLAGPRRWLIPAGVAVAAAAVGAGAILLTGGHAAGSPGGQAGPGTAGATASPKATGAARSPSATGSAPAGGASSPAAGAAAGPPLTLAQAQAAVAGYTTANNSANAQRSGTALAAIETGSSLAIDTALYRAQRAAGTAPFPPFSPVKATYYIPRGEPAGGPRWFAVKVGNAFQSNPGQVTSTEYLLFTQAPGGAWLDTLEPYLVAGAAEPKVALDAGGLATAVPLDAATAAVKPGQLAAATAASLDTPGGGQAGITAPATLADIADQRFWQAKLPGGQVTDAHAAAAGADGQAFALRTTDGGALVFYTDTARLTITPPAGSMLHLTIPGFVSPGQAMAQANLNYTDQFAAYDPPAGGGTPRIVAAYAAITSTGTG